MVLLHVWEVPISVLGPEASCTGDGYFTIVVLSPVPNYKLIIAIIIVNSDVHLSILFITWQHIYC
jgi:hypothetical protein